MPNELRDLCRKEIIYDRETRDYAMYLDGELVGFAHNYHEAEVELDRLVWHLMIDVREHNAAVQSRPAIPGPDRTGKGR